MFFNIAQCGEVIFNVTCWERRFLLEMSDLAD